MAVPTVQKFNNTEIDLNSVEECANTSSPTYTSRLAGEKLSLTGAIAKIVHGEISAFSAGTTYTDVDVWVEESGIVYRPLPSALPIGPGAFDANEWVVARGFGVGDRLSPAQSSYDDLRNITTTGMADKTPVEVTDTGKTGTLIYNATGATANDITGVTLANPCVVTYSGTDNWSNGDTVHIQKIAGTTELNGNRYTVANVDTGANTLELSGVDSSAYTAYVSGGVVSNDNDGTIIVVNANAYFERAGTDNIINVKWFRAAGDGVTDDAAALIAAVTEWRNSTAATLYFPAGYYVSTLPLNFANLGAAVKIIRGEKSWIDFQGLGNEPALVDCLNSKELRFESLRIRYQGDYDDEPSTAPEVGILIARNLANDFSGRHQFIDVRVSGIYQIAAFYNSGCEEIIYDDCEFRNTLEGVRSTVITCDNHLGATSSNGDITNSAISTTLNTFIQPAFYSNANARENVCIRGAGGLTMINPYSSAGGSAHYAIQAISQSCTAIKLIGYQCEVERGSTGISADYAVRFEGDGTLDVSGCELSTQFTTSVVGEILIETVRDFKRNIINTGGDVLMSGTSRNMEGCDIRAAAGCDLSTFDNVLATKIYSDLRSTIVLPVSSKSCDIDANDLDGPTVVGKVKQRSTASTVSLDEALVGFSGAGTINDFTSDFSGLPYIALTRYGYCVSASVTISNSGGNIRTNTGADIVLTANQYVEIIYNGNADKFYVRLMGG